MFLIQGASLEKCQSLVRIKEVPFKDNAEQCPTDACSYSLDKFLIHTFLPCLKSFFHLLPVWGYCYRDIALPISAKLFSHFSDKWSTTPETFQKSSLSQTNTGCCLHAAPASGRKPSLSQIPWELLALELCKEPAGLQETGVQTPKVSVPVHGKQS